MREERVQGMLKMACLINGKRKLRRIYLDELPPNAGNYHQEKETECGIFCQQAETTIALDDNEVLNAT